CFLFLISLHMYSPFQLTIKYLNYYLTASGSKGHGMHSPFVFDFITKVLNDKTNYPEYEKAENLRHKLLMDDKMLNVEDFGAGSSISNKKKRSVSSIAKHAARPKKYGQLLFRIVKHFEPDTILELGTSLGISSYYMSLGSPNARVITLEGAKEVANLSNDNFRLLGLKNIELVQGNFDDNLSSVISGLSAIDFAFIDGNHRQEPTERYFRQLLPKVNNESVLVFDDIHWSRDMELAWESIKKNPAVRCSIDLFFTGIIFFRKEFKEKQHFTIRF
ncbi:MAG TPA: class I SAM-dependent methyltransferase, partial [Chitinophagaceae bacterium]|nr:class I SAM-dependent methyltransferase [Chitinophagaceae bacterium]